MARPKRQDQRRAELVEAAREAVLERGMLGLRLRDVAERAGLTSGAVLYYYPSLTGLLEEVQRAAVERFCDLRTAAVAAESDPRRRLVAMIGSGLPSGPDDELCTLLYELGTIARRDAAYAARHIDLFGRQVAIYSGILAAGAATGVFTLATDALTIARNLVVLEDGYGLHLVQAVAPIDTATAERTILAYASLATGCEL